MYVQTLLNLVTPKRHTCLVRIFAKVPKLSLETEMRMSFLSKPNVSNVNFDYKQVRR